VTGESVWVEGLQSWPEVSQVNALYGGWHSLLLRRYWGENSNMKYLIVFVTALLTIAASPALGVDTHRVAQVVKI